MPTSAISDVIRYYRDCFQASFFSSAGFGLFDNKDIVPLAIRSLDDPLPWSEQWQQQYVIDADQVNLMRIDGIVLVPEPNSAATTDCHYRPARVALMNAWADDPDAEPDWDEEWQTQLQSDSAAAPVYDCPSLPSLTELSQWLQSQAKQCTERSMLPVRILLLVPKNFRAAAYKADFVAHLDRLVQQHHNPDSLLWQFLLKQSAQSRVDDEQHQWPFLSSHQNQALNSAISQRLSLIQGPPGTGKSRLLATLSAQIAGEGRAVLLTSHSDHALTVLKEKLINDVGIDPRWIAHIGPGRRTRKLAEQFSQLMTAQDRKTDASTANLTQSRKSFQSQHRKLIRALSNQPTIDEQWLSQNPSSWQSVKQSWWSLWHRDHHYLNRKIESFHNSIDQLRQAFGADINQKLQSFFNVSRHWDSEAWATLTQSLRRNGLRQAVNQLNRTRGELFSPTAGIKLWLIKLDDLPEQAFALFDSVVIDEATQVNMAEAIPALAMSRRAVIAGDPRQLRHYSFLSHKQEERIAQSLHLAPESVVSFRDTSLLDYSEQYLTSTSSFNACHLLDEHYRSVPPLMDFNSRRFYQGNVQVLTGLQQVNNLKLHLNWKLKANPRINKVNAGEAQEVIDYLKQLITRERNLTSSEKTSIGVLSFFRDQTEHLKQQILQECSLSDIRAHQVKVGTPFSFQGEERDHMLISCAIDDNSHAGTWGYLNQADVFNVATSRARRRQTLFLSASPQSLPVTSVLRNYFDFSRAPQNTPDTNPALPAWLNSLIDTMQQAGFRTLTQQYIADIPIDLILEADDRTLAIDLIGFPSDIGHAVHLQRYQALFRAGIPLFPLTAKEWILDPKAVSQELLRWAQQHDQRLTGLTESASSTRSDLIPAKLWRGLAQCQQSPEIQNEFDADQCNLTEQIQQLDTLLRTLFKPGSLTYLRYQSAITSVSEQMLENLETYRLLFTQVWEQGSHDHTYWTSLIDPIRQRHSDYQAAMMQLQVSLQETVARQSPDNFQLHDLEALTERLKHYQ